jgi:glucose-1-phosphate thymidylyltransferase
VYFLRPSAFDLVNQLVPSGRGELEITDLLNCYLPGDLFAPRYEGQWTDAGTVSSLLRAAELAEQQSQAGALPAPPERPVS